MIAGDDLARAVQDRASEAVRNSPPGASGVRCRTMSARGNCRNGRPKPCSRRGARRAWTRLDTEVSRLCKCGLSHASQEPRAPATASRPATSLAALRRGSRRGAGCKVAPVALPSPRPEPRPGRAAKKNRPEFPYSPPALPHRHRVLLGGRGADPRCYRDGFVWKGPGDFRADRHGRRTRNPNSRSASRPATWPRMRPCGLVRNRTSRPGGCAHLGGSRRAGSLRPLGGQEPAARTPS